MDFTCLLVVGFDGKATQLIDIALIMNLTIHGRNFLRIYFLVIDMMHGIIFGRKWFEKYGVKIDCQGKNLNIPMKYNTQISKIFQWMKQLTSKKIANS